MRGSRLGFLSHHLTVRAGLRSYALPIILGVRISMRLAFSLGHFHSRSADYPRRTSCGLDSLTSRFRVRESLGLLCRGQVTVLLCGYLCNLLILLEPIPLRLYANYNISSRIWQVYGGDSRMHQIVLETSTSRTSAHRRSHLP